MAGHDTANILWKHREPVDVSTTKFRCTCSGGQALYYVLFDAFEPGMSSAEQHGRLSGGRAPPRVAAGDAPADTEAGTRPRMGIAAMVAAVAALLPGKLLSRQIYDRYKIHIPIIG